MFSLPFKVVILKTIILEYLNFLCESKCELILNKDLSVIIILKLLGSAYPFIICVCVLACTNHPSLGQWYVHFLV